MKALIAALALATLISAAHPATAAPGKLGSDSYLSGQNEKCYRWGQCDIISDENTRLRD